MSYPRLKVHHLNCSCFEGLRVRGRPLACHCLLVETPASGLVLVDTGLSRKDLISPMSRLGPSFTAGAGPVSDANLSALVQINAMGFQAEDVRHIVLTHMDLDHVSGLEDFPHATVHLHALELASATRRASALAQHRYKPELWDHNPRFRTYADVGDPWFGFAAVRELEGLPPEILMVPLFGHTAGHSGIAVEANGSWMLHAGDAYFDSGEVREPQRNCSPQVALFQAILDTDRTARLYNQDRLRALIREHPEVSVFSAHDPFETPPRKASTRADTQIVA
jgi:glyoxylase-like metal-dependent hydrolase (beta-lactamase superfamily II)